MNRIVSFPLASLLAVTATLITSGCAVGLLGGLAEDEEPGTAEPPSGAGGAELPGVGCGGGAPSEPTGALSDPFGEPGFAFIPAGTFTMGSPPDDPHNVWWNGYQWEKQHEVTLTHNIWMGETEVTQAQWIAVMGDNPSVFQACGTDCPVENVTWYQMISFCNALSQQQGREVCYRDGDDGTPYDAEDADARRHPAWPAGYDCTGYRLPTEAEWEYAARAGTTTTHFLGEASHENVAQAAWYGPNSQCQYAGCENESYWAGTGAHEPSGTHPVGQRVPNPWGLYDTSGNVWEFVWDFFGEYHDGLVVDPVGPQVNQVSYHVARGGSWMNLTLEARSATRDGDDCTGDPDNGPGPHTGFRICRSLP
ncbi:MAG: formylglycine-generating enzyme family protein [Deltaproteobacteria bacterium]|nr:formylglycine-generating enzyme family protein [Deltaproteobacteria bacterium]